MASVTTKAEKQEEKSKAKEEEKKPSAEAPKAKKVGTGL